MPASVDHLDSSDLRPILTAVCRVAHDLSLQYGQRQFYTLAQVQLHAGSCGVDRLHVAWVFAALVTRADFEAYYAVRDVPGTYQHLRAALSEKPAHIVPAGSSAEDPREALWSALDWLDLAADIQDLA